MEVAPLTRVKNELSRYVELVRRGERVRILVRGVPVADLVPVAADASADDQSLVELERAGWLRRGQGGIDDELLRRGPKVRGHRMARTIAEERRSR